MIHCAKRDNKSPAGSPSLRRLALKEARCGCMGDELWRGYDFATT